LERNPPGASEYARRFLDSTRASIILGDRVEKQEDGEYLTGNDRPIPADMAVWCTGPRPNPPAMIGFGDTIYTKHNALRVNRKLQLRDHPHIFVGGDLAAVREEKTAQNAKRHAAVIAKNITRSLAGRSLLDYTPRTGPLVISLGARCGLMTYRNRYITGPIPGMLKWGIEAGELAQYRGLPDWLYALSRI
ncbi:MAG: FAD-dependent oxidoreductase, partial [Planctomycetes bacterium]|nr:FAD-dependent oxidoreductase [Planctomycetota bacterium]